MSSADPGSFRDPASHIVHDGDRVLRLLDERGLNGWRALAKSEFFARATNDGHIIQSTEVGAPEGYAGAVEHPRLAFISYPYEWTFSMLKDAALLQLELLAGALEDGLTIKDATPFNIQFDRGRPVFIDIGSFEEYVPGEPWIGYRQFTRQFLFPLMMRAWIDIPFQPWLRGDMEGPTAAQMRRMLPTTKRFRPSAMMHVSLQARMEARLSGEAVRKDLREAGFSSELILANVRKLARLVSSLEWRPSASTWSGYQGCEHVGRDRERKSEFLTEVLNKTNPGRVLDLGANDGHFSRIAQESAHVVAVDGDEAVLDDLYRRSVGMSVSLVLADLANPAPSQGWAGKERASLGDRASPDLIVAYGLIHHLIYTASIPPETVLRWLRSFDCAVALEYVAPEDEMVRKLIANKLDSELHPGRTEAEFKALLRRQFEIAAETALGEGSRTLFELAPA